MQILEMAVDYNWGYCFRDGAPKEAQSGKWSPGWISVHGGGPRVVSLFLW